MSKYNKFFLKSFGNSNKESLKYLEPIDSVSTIKEKEIVDSCPLCHQHKYVLVGKFSFERIIDDWVSKYSFNPIPDVYKGETLNKYHCLNCGLNFYNYHLFDTQQMYDLLARSNRYYPTYRPEYGIASELIEEYKPTKLLEIGSGEGVFLEIVANMGYDVYGNEYSAEANRICLNKGLKMLEGKIEDLPQEQFDVVCHFEVLAHVFSIEKFIEQTLRILKNGGKLIIGTPNPDGIGQIINRFQLNLPPHHQFEFSKECFLWIAKKYHLEMINYIETELDYAHYARYVKILTNKELETPDIGGYYQTKQIYSGTSHVVVFKKL